MGRVVRVAIALGSNLGDRHAHLNHAIHALRAILTDLRVSSFIETTPVGVLEPQPDYLNAVVVGDTTLTARELFDALMRIEHAHGRERRSFNAARTLDLDLILYGRETIDEPGLQVPHPRYREREFVMAPLREIAPEMIAGPA